MTHFETIDRFAILSLSVDEKIDEPKRFQEKRQLPWTQAFLAGGMHGPIPGTFGIRAIPAFVLVGPDGKIVARGMRGDNIKKEVARALAMSRRLAAGEIGRGPWPPALSVRRLIQLGLSQGQARHWSLVLEDLSAMSWFAGQGR